MYAVPQQTFLASLQEEAVPWWPSSVVFFFKVALFQTASVDRPTGDITYPPNVLDPQLPLLPQNLVVSCLHDAASDLDAD